MVLNISAKSLMDDSHEMFNITNLTKKKSAIDGKNEVPKYCITLCLSADDSHKILILVWVFTTLYSHLLQIAKFLFISSMSLEGLGFIFLVNLLRVIVMLCYADICLNFINQLMSINFHKSR